jgi:hypothetical protein
LPTNDVMSMLVVAIAPPHPTVLSLRMAVAIYVTGISTPEVHLEFPPLLGTLTDARYPSIIYQAMEAMAAMRAPTRGRVNVLDRGGCVEISAYWQHWQCLFPQHGPGRKHARPILLEPWQARIAAAHPQLLLRGLIHSDGCRVTNRVWGGKYSYPRYFFTNKSSDILEIFRAACDVLGISYRNSKPDTISIAKRKDVAALDSFIGPKT